MTRVAGWYWAAVTAVLAALVVFAADVASATARLEIYLLLAILAGCCWFGRRPGPFGPGPFGPGAAGAGPVRLVLYLGVAAHVALIVADARDRRDSWDELTSAGLPIQIGMTTLFLLAGLALTAQASPLPRRGILVGAGLGVAAATAWLIPVLISPPLPTVAATALGWLTVAMVAAAALLRSAGGRSPWWGAALAGAIGSLLITDLAFGLLRLSPAWVPDIGGNVFVPWSTPAERLAANAQYAQDPYVLILFLGALLSLAILGDIAVRRRRRVEPITAPLVLPRF